MLVLFCDKSFMSHQKLHWWFSGRILACHAGGPGSIPGQCRVLFRICMEMVAFLEKEKKRQVNANLKSEIAHISKIDDATVSST